MSSLKKIGILILITAVILIPVLSLSGCSASTEDSSELHRSEISDRLVLVDGYGMQSIGFSVYVDKDTRVSYLCYRSSYAICFTPLLNSDGTPILYEGSLD